MASTTASAPRSPRPAPPVVRFESVGLRYGRGPEVLNNISFSLAPGSFHFLTGQSGAGKTTLLKLIYLAMRPSRGLISLFGDDATAVSRTALPAIRRRMGVVFQDFRLLEHLDVFENVALPLRVAGAARESYVDDVKDLIGWVGLGHRMDAAPATLSGGEKQRVAIARAVVAKPDILLADEPTGNVDPDLSVRLVRLFVELNRLGGCVLIATHDNALARAVDAPRLHLEGGRLERLTAAA